MAAYKYDESIYVDGRRYRIRANTQREFAEKAATIRERAERGDPSNLTVEQWVTKWMQVYKVDVSPRRLSDIEHQKKMLEPISKRKLADIRPSDLQEILNRFAGKAAATIKTRKVFLTDCFGTAYKADYIKTDLTKALTMPRGKPAKARRALTAAEYSLVMRAVHDHPGGAFIAIALHCGLRPGEVSALLWQDVDFKKKRITVNKAVVADKTVGPPKSKAGNRSVPMPDDLVDILRPIKGSPFSLVCPNRAGNMHTQNSRSRMWHSFKRTMHIAAGGKTYRNAILPPYIVADDIDLYCLRHTYATHLQAAGVPINVARELLGHEDISTTAKIYTHASEEPLNEAVKNLNAYARKIASK